MLRGYRHLLMVPFEVEVLLSTKVCVFHVEVCGRSAGAWGIDLCPWLSVWKERRPEREINGNCKPPYLKTRMPALNLLFLIRKAAQHWTHYTPPGLSNAQGDMTNTSN